MWRMEDKIARCHPCMEHSSGCSNGFSVNQKIQIRLNQLEDDKSLFLGRPHQRLKHCLIAPIIFLEKADQLLAILPTG